MRTLLVSKCGARGKLGMHRKGKMKGDYGIKSVYSSRVELNDAYFCYPRVIRACIDL